MKSAIEKLFYGSFKGVEALKLSEKQRKYLNVIVECDEKLTALLKDNQEAGELFERFKCAVDENAGAEALGFYKEGFRNGFQIALDGAKEE